MQGPNVLLAIANARNRWLWELLLATRRERDQDLASCILVMDEYRSREERHQRREARRGMRRIANDRKEVKNGGTDYTG